MYSNEQMPSLSRPWLVPLCLAAAGLLLYSTVLELGPRLDDHWILERLADGTFWERSRPPRRALVNVTFVLSHRLHGTAPLGYHLFNIACHILAAVGVWRLARALLRGPRAGPAAALAGAVFLCHPLATQAVTYMCQRYSCLAVALAVWALVAYCHARRAPPARAGGYLAGAVLLTVGAMLCKEFVAALPLLALALEVLVFRDFQGEGRRLRPWLALVPLLLALLLVPLVYVVLTRDAGMATGRGLLPDWSTGRVPRGVYLLTQWKVVLGTYFRLLLVPWGQTIDHGFTPARGLLEPGVLLSGFVLTAILAGGVLLWRRAPVICFGVILVYLGLAPTSTIVPNTEFVAEQRVYFSLVGFALLAGRVSMWLSRRWLWTVGTLYCLTLGGLTLARNQVWQDELGLWREAMQRSPGIPRPPCAVADVLRRRGQHEAAVAYYRRALAIAPGYRGALAHLPLSLEALGREREALEAYGELLQRYPDFVPGLYNCGLLLLRLERPARAREVTAQLLRHAPAHPGGLMNQAQALEMSKRPDEAAGYYRRLTEVDGAPPGMRCRAWYRLIHIRREQEQWAGVAEACRAFAGECPVNVETSLVWAAALRRLGRLQAAQARLQESLATVPETDRGVRGRLHLALARVALARRRPAQARRHYRAALDHGAPPDNQMADELQLLSPTPP